MPATGVEIAAKASKECGLAVHDRTLQSQNEWSEDEFVDSAIVTDSDCVKSEALPFLFSLGARSGANVVVHLALLEKKTMPSMMDSGLSIVHSTNTQEAYDVALCCHAFALHGLGPILHVIDSTRTSFAYAYPLSTLQDSKQWINNQVQMQEDAVSEDKFRIVDEMESIFASFRDKSKRSYSAFEYHGVKNATRVVVASGSTARACIEWLKRHNKSDMKVGVVLVRVSRPWSPAHFLKILPQTVHVICATDDVFAEAAASFHHEAAQGRENEPPLFVKSPLGSSVSSVDEAAMLMEDAPIVDTPSFLRSKTSSSLIREIVCASSFTTAKAPLVAEVLGLHLGMKVQEYDSYQAKHGLFRKEVRLSPIDISSLQLPVARADVICLESLSQADAMLGAHLGKASTVVMNTTASELNRELSSKVKALLEKSSASIYAIDGEGILRKSGAPQEALPFIMIACALHLSSDVSSYTQGFVHLSKRIQEILGSSESSKLLTRELTDNALGSGSWLKKVQLPNVNMEPTVFAKINDCTFKPLQMASQESAYGNMAMEENSYHRLLTRLFGNRLVTYDMKQSLESSFGKYLSLRDEEKQNKSHWIICSSSRIQDVQGVHHILASDEKINVLLLCDDAHSKIMRDVGLYAMNYGNSYVASICEEAAYNQATKAFTEADSRTEPGSSIIIALVGNKAAVETGDWPLYRWNPSNKEGVDPFSLDSSKLKSDVHEFLKRDQHLSLMARRKPRMNQTLTKSVESELDRKGHSAEARAAEKRLQATFANLRAGLQDVEEKENHLNLLILYGSDGGNAAGVAESLARKAELSGCGETRCIEANEFKCDDLENESHVILVLATAGQGEDTANAKSFTAEVMARKSKLSKLKYAVFGLGDSHYWGEGTADSMKYFCLPAKRIHEKLKELHATPLVDVGLGDDQHDDGYDGALSEWEPAMWKALDVKVNSSDLGGAPPVTDDEIKINSNYLRGTIAEGLADLSTGKLVFEDTKLTKFHGIYQQDNRDEREALDAKGLERAYSFMIRIGVPGGVASAKQYLMMADLCDKYANGKLKLTTRQAYQFHGIIKKNLKLTMQGINRAAMDSLAACGDVHRNIMANPRFHDGKAFQKVTEIAQQINAHLKPKTSAYHEIWLDKKPVAGYKDHEPLYGPTYLPRKFKIAMAVPPENDVDVFAHCVGLIAIVQNDHLLGFNVCAGGGFGTTHGDKNTFPRLSDVLGFCTVEQVVKVVEGILVTQRDHGERLNRKHARLKYTVEDHGYAWFRGKVEDYCGFRLSEARPFKFETNADNYGWRRGDRTGLWTYTMFVENGWIHDDNPQYKLKSAMRELAETLVTFDGEISLTANQNLILGAIPDHQKQNIIRILNKWGVDNEQYSAMRLHSMACVALPTCALAMAESQRYLPSLISKLEHTLDEVGLRHDAITIRMTGCPNGCARPYVAEIAFVGKAPGVYNLHLGGGFAGNRLNRIYKEGVNEEQILSILRPLLIRYAGERFPNERFGDFLIRIKEVMPVYHGHSFWAKDESENDTSSRSGTVQLYW